MKLKLSCISKMFYHTFSSNQNLYYPRLPIRENDEDSATPAVDSGHLGYRKFVSDFRTSLITPGRRHSKKSTIDERGSKIDRNSGNRKHCFY